MIKNAEISSTGIVSLEGQLIGQIEGFRFTITQTNTGSANIGSANIGSDPASLKACLKPILMDEYRARSERLVASANSDFAISHDGIIRWIGQPMAKLTSGHDPLKPSFILLIDEQLTDEIKEKLIWRLNRFIGFYFESILKPLFSLSHADKLNDQPRQFALKLAHHFGVLPRRMISNDVKQLDQLSRSSLRRLGIRFGAYHIFVPALLKPAAARAILLLGGLHYDLLEEPYFRDVLQTLTTGRTSVPVDLLFKTEFYKLAGYFILGSCAIRIDILERLADLIRHALSWQPDLILTHDGSDPAKSNPEKPDGAYDGKCFFVTPAMMSILGVTNQTMEEILTHLGYRSQLKEVPFNSDKPYLQNTGPTLNKNFYHSKSGNSKVCSKPSTQETIRKAEPVGPAFILQSIFFSVPEAEPVGPLSSPQEPQFITLWFYHGHQHKHQNHKASQNRNHFLAKNKENSEKKEVKSGYKQTEHYKRNTPKQNLKQQKSSTQPPSSTNSDAKTNQPKKYNKMSKPMRFKPMVSKPIDPNSPFSKLSILFDQLKK